MVVVDIVDFFSLSGKIDSNLKKKQKTFNKYHSISDYSN